MQEGTAKVILDRSLTNPRARNVATFALDASIHSDSVVILARDFSQGGLKPLKTPDTYTLPTQRGLATTMQFTKILCTLVAGACYGTSSPAPDGNCSSASDNIALIQRQASVQAHSADPSPELTNVESASAQSITSPTQVSNQCANILEQPFRNLFNRKLYVPTPSNPHPPLHSLRSFLSPKPENDTF